MFLDDETQLEIHATLGQEISSGTLHAFDLTSAILGVLRDTPEYSQLISSMVVPAYALDDRESDWWHTEEATHLLEELNQVMDSYTPEGYYFGNPNDHQPETFGFYKYE